MSKTNLVFEKGIATVEVVNGGVGYFGSPTIIVADLNQSGTGAELGFHANSIDEYGQISVGGINIFKSGENYTTPIISIVPDPNQPSPVETAVIKAHLSHTHSNIQKLNRCFIKIDLHRNFITRIETRYLLHKPISGIHISVTEYSFITR